MTQFIKHLPTFFKPTAGDFVRPVRNLKVYKVEEQNGELVICSGDHKEKFNPKNYVVIRPFKCTDEIKQGETGTYFQGYEMKKFICKEMRYNEALKRTEVKVRENLWLPLGIVFKVIGPTHETRC